MGVMIKIQLWLFVLLLGVLALSEHVRAEQKNDFETGLNIDQAAGAPARFEVLNVEGAGAQGMRNLLQDPAEYGSVLRLCVTSMPGKDGTALFVNGKPQGSRDRAEGS